MSENEYKEWVLAAYENKKATEQLASELLSPTPARVKAESVRSCEQRFKAGDEKILRSFFDEKDGKASYLNAIKNCNAEIFKPVITFFVEKKAYIEFKKRGISCVAARSSRSPLPSRFEIAGRNESANSDLGN